MVAYSILLPSLTDCLDICGRSSLTVFGVEPQLNIRAIALEVLELKSVEEKVHAMFFHVARHRSLPNMYLTTKIFDWSDHLSMVQCKPFFPEKAELVDHEYAQSSWSWYSRRTSHFNACLGTHRV